MRKTISPGLHDLFEKELIPLINNFSPDSFGEVDQEVKWKAFEGAVEEAMHRIRIHITTKLNLDVNKIYFKKMRTRLTNKIQEELAEVQINTRNLCKLASDIERINSIDKLIDEAEFEKAQRRILKYLSYIKEDDRINMFGTTDPYIILDQLSYQGEKARECGDWLHTIIGQLINDETSIKASQRQSNKIRESYSDNPRKTLNNFILNKVQPQYSIDECTLHDYFADSFRINDNDFVPDEDGIFAISNCFIEHDKEIFLNLITDEDSFVEVIKSRKFESAAGPGGIDYSVFKFSPNVAAKFLCTIARIIINVGRVPHSWKKSIMRLLYKIGR